VDETTAPTSPPVRRRRSVAVAILCVLVSLEAASFVAGKILQAHWLMYGVPKPPAERLVATYSEYLRRRDPELGWPFPDQYGGKLFNATGARPSPAFPDTTPETAQISLYGESFTQSPNSDEDAWGNVLAVLSGRRVANYGQGGYGTDQAFLRYRRNVRDKAGVVILSHVTEDILRNLTRDRDLILYEMWFAYKPRFVLGADGRLELVPMPTLTEQEHLRLEGAAAPQLDLEHESFHPGGPAGATSLRFPFTWSLVRNLGDFRMRARISGRTYYAEFYAPGHPLHGLEITREICKGFAEEAKRRGQHPLVMLLPNREDVDHFRKSKEWTYAPLARELETHGVELLDFGPSVAGRAGDRSLDEVYDHTGHYRKEVDRLLAEFVLAKIRTLPDFADPPRADSK